MALIPLPNAVSVEGVVDGDSDTGRWPPRGKLKLRHLGVGGMRHHIVLMERNRCLVAWATGLPRTPCFHVRRKLMWKDKHIEAHTNTCIALIDSTGFVASAVSMARVPMQRNRR
jgi:hypothetical protein